MNVTESGSWNYRVLRHADDYFAIHSVYYDKHGNAHSVSVTPAAVAADTTEEILAELDRFKAALERPVLQFSQFASS
jgi:hypothetical protein